MVPPPRGETVRGGTPYPHAEPGVSVEFVAGRLHKQSFYVVGIALQRWPLRKRESL